MPFQPCGGSPVTIIATKDTTGVNSGNYTAAFTSNVLGTMPAIWEWYHGIIDTQSGALFTPAPCNIRVNQLKPVSFTYPDGGTEFDPSQPIEFRQGDELYFFFQLASTNTPAPRVTLYLRYDLSLPANQGFRG